ncbi:MAG TPA: SLC13 family permease [Blastocatellia bacterium]|nr:SLC13 family permease [Blastocatellia bacterium]
MAIAFVFIILLIAIVLYVTEALPMDLVAILALLSLALAGVITPAEAFLGFGDPVIITLTSFFVISAALFNTGVVEAIGHRIHRLAGDGETKLLVIMMLTASSIAAFMSNVVTTAVLMPGVIAIAKRIRTPASMFLMPLAFGAVLGGKCTLAGSPTNLAVNGLLPKYGLEPFGLFEFAPIGVPIVITGVLYMALLGSRLLPRRVNGLAAEGRAEKDYLTELVVLPDSPLIARTLAEADFRGKYELRIIGIVHGGERVLPHGEAVLRPGDVLLVRGKPDKILSIKESQGLGIKSDTMSVQEAQIGAVLYDGRRDARHDGRSDTETVIVEAIIAPNSTFVGRTLRQIHFRSRYGADVLAIYRHDQALYENLEDIQLRVGDMLLIQGRRRRIDSLREDPNFLTLDDVPHTRLRKNKAAWAVAIFVGVAVTAGLNLAPIALCSLAGATSMLLAGCITAREAYARVEWPIIVLIAATLPLGVAMEKTGAARLAAQHVTRYLGDHGPIVVMGGFFLFAVALTQTMVNAAAALLLTPIAINVAQQLHVNPRAFAMTIAIAASTSFATPLEPACAIVYGPGRYRFADYVRVGGILTICVMAVTLLVIPIFWPLR